MSEGKIEMGGIEVIAVIWMLMVWSIHMLMTGLARIIGLKKDSIVLVIIDQYETELTSLIETHGQYSNKVREILPCKESSDTKLFGRIDGFESKTLAYSIKYDRSDFIVLLYGFIELQVSYDREPLKKVPLSYFEQLRLRSFIVKHSKFRGKN
jgi:hypothetical protein